MVGLAIGCVCGLICVIIGAIIVNEGDFGYTYTGTPESSLAASADSLPHTFVELLPLLLNVLVTIMTECMGYIHTASLRWALWHEARLQFNSNLRLFSSAHHCKANHWASNIIWVVCLISCYTATSQILYTNTQSELDAANNFYPVYYETVNGVALLALGLGLLGQAIIAIWSLLSTSNQILTWSSNPLNATLACLTDGKLQHCPGRCMVSVLQSSSDSPILTTARRSQQNAARSNPSVPYIVYFIWALTPLCLIWGTIIMVLTIKTVPREIRSWGFGSSVHNVEVPIGHLFSNALTHFCAFLFVAFLQTLITLGLHTAELLVNLYRDERLWRRAAVCIKAADLSVDHQANDYVVKTTSSRGASIDSSSIKAALTSIPALILFALKPAVHYLSASVSL